MKVDSIIVGQGLAGSCLALALAHRGKTFMVFDEPAKNHTTAVAPGLFNPIIGKGLTKTWMAETTFPFAEKFYQGIERQLGCRFYHPMPIYRPFISVEEQNEWMALSEGRLKSFIEKTYTSPAFGNFMNDPLGGILVKKSGYVNTVTLMSSVVGWLKKNGQYRESHVDFDRLKIESGNVLYEDVEAKDIIFCDGVRVKKNPFFSWVYINCLKGETLTIQLTNPLNVIFNRGVYLVPTANPLVCLVGATYKPNDATENFTPEGEQELREKLDALIKIPYTVEDRHWGIRPAVPDRRPVLGHHPLYKNVFLLNGMGTKGVTLAPYFATSLAARLDQAGEIPDEVNIKRFKSLYSKFGFSSNV